MTTFLGLIVGSSGTYMILKNDMVGENPVWNYIMIITGGLVFGMLGIIV